MRVSFLKLGFALCLAGLPSSALHAQDSSVGDQGSATKGEVSAEDLSYLQEYGAYLAGECTGCHKLTGEFEGIPVLQHLDEEHFIDAMRAYKTEERVNQAMINVAKNLDDEMIRALALYFTTLETNDGADSD